MLHLMQDMPHDPALDQDKTHMQPWEECQKNMKQDSYHSHLLNGLEMQTLFLEKMGDHSSFSV